MYHAYLCMYNTHTHVGALCSHHHAALRVGIFMRGISSRITIIETKCDETKRPIATRVLFHLATRSFCSYIM